MHTHLQPEATQTAVVAHKGKWGYYSCDYATYVALKSLAKLEREAYRKYKSWQRWQRKLPHNRVYRKYLRDPNTKWKIGTEVTGPKPEPGFNKTLWLKTDRWNVQKFEGIGAIEAYKQARYPVSDPSKLKPQLMSLAQANAHLAAILGS